MMNHTKLMFALLLLPMLAACGSGGSSDERGGKTDHDEKVPITNRVDVPPAVRRNLGISFAKAEMRQVASTVRVPGVFEALPFAHRAYHATLGGTVEILVRQYDRVEVGTPLLRLDSPEWREMQQELMTLVIEVRSAQARMGALDEQIEAVHGHAEQLKVQRGVWADRLQQLEDLGAAVGGVASARTQALAELAAVDTATAETKEEIAQLMGEQALLVAKLAGCHACTPLLYQDVMGSTDSDGHGSEGHGSGAPLIDIALERAASVLGLTVADLRTNVGTEEQPVPRWRVIDQIEIVARQAGVVEALPVTNGAWVNMGDVMLATVDTAQVRFRGVGLQADLARLRDGLAAKVLPPREVPGGRSGALSGTLVLGLELDPLTRKIDLLVVPDVEQLPHWARIGVSTEMEIVLAGGEDAQLAIPLGATIQDGLERILFRRDPKDPDKVIRLPADLGINDGRWVVVESGLMEGDEVVAGGIYELMLASGGGDKQKGGHFHADGTFHEGDD